MKTVMQLIDKLEKEHILEKEEFCFLLEHITENEETELYRKASAAAKAHYGNSIYVRGLMEFTNYCKNDCYYCGIRRSNGNASRYRLTEDQIMDCCREGYELGFRTFVLQGGEDPWFSDEKIASLVKKIKGAYPDCAVTLSVGEKEYETYKMWFDAGADRYLLRHETADPCHYASLHPPLMSSEHRKQCLKNLKAIGYQTGCGIMVGSPYQTAEHIAEDMKFMYELQPEMVGIGPFIPHHDTPFKNRPAGTLRQTLLLLAMVRLMLPRVLLPATTALGTIDPKGREKGVLAGANVVMPNLSPVNVRKKYMLYDNKISTGMEAASNIRELKERMASIGYEVVVDRGDFIGRQG
ncbi:MAG: [FeFe] hydrogenase H-cluster radical SAM maturase HydE [Enterocloster sp.]